MQQSCPAARERESNEYDMRGGKQKESLIQFNSRLLPSHPPESVEIGVSVCVCMCV